MTARLAVRDALVRSRTKFICLVRALLLRDHRVRTARSDLRPFVSAEGRRSETQGRFNEARQHPRCQHPKQSPRLQLPWVGQTSYRMANCRGSLWLSG